MCLISTNKAAMHCHPYMGWFDLMPNPSLPSYKSQPAISMTQLSHILFIMKLLVPAFLLLALGYLGTAEVVQSFGKCLDFFFKGIPPNLLSDSKYKTICQKRTEANGYEFATLYDTNLRIPVYSAYKFQAQGSCSRNTPWYIEPQVSGSFSLLYILK